MLGAEAARAAGVSPATPLSALFHSAARLLARQSSGPRNAQPVSSTLTRKRTPQALIAAAAAAPAPSCRCPSPQVSYLVRCPYWRTHTEEQPAVLCTDFATEEERATACNKWAVSSRCRWWWLLLVVSAPVRSHAPPRRRCCNAGRRAGIAANPVWTCVLPPGAAC